MRTPHLTLTMAALLALGCGGGEPTGAEGAIQNALAFTRPDNSRVQFPRQPTVWCGAWEEGFVATPALHILVVRQAPREPYWYLRAVLADVAPGQPDTFPNGFTFDQPRNVDMFVFDPPNELSTQQSSSGQIVFQQFGCGSSAQVEFTIDALIGSEFGGGPPLTVTGSFRSPVGNPPGAAVHR